MQKFKTADGGNVDGTAKDKTELDPGTTYKAKVINDNSWNIFNLVEQAGYTLVDDDLSQLTKALKGRYKSTFTYNTSSIVTQTVNDVVLGSDGLYYEAQANAIIGDNPVGSITGKWKLSNDSQIIHTVSTRAELLAFPKIDGISVYATGHTSSNDGGSGILVYDESKSAINNEVTIFIGWERQYIGAINAKWSGATGDGVTDDTVAITKIETAFSGEDIDLGGGTYITTLIDSSLTNNYFNGSLIVKNVLPGDTTHPIKPTTTLDDFSLVANRRKSQILEWEGKTVLWLGTSIPHQGENTDSYPTLFGEYLGCKVINMAWSGSHANYNIDGDAFEIDTIISLSMTEDDRAAGEALYGASSAYNDNFHPVTKASQMTCDYRIGTIAEDEQIDIVILDHNHNDRARDKGILDSTSYIVTGVTFGATTILTLDDSSAISVGDSIVGTIQGIKELFSLAARVQSTTATTVTINIDTSLSIGTFTGGGIQIVDKYTLYGAFLFLEKFIVNQSFNTSGNIPDIVFAGAPSLYTNDTKTPTIWSNFADIRDYADERGFSAFDVAHSMEVTEQDQLFYFPDDVHPTTLVTRNVLATHWASWAKGGKIIPSGTAFLESNNVAINNREALYSIFDRKWGSRTDIILDGLVLINEIFTNLAAWTIDGTSTVDPMVQTSSWDVGENSVLFNPDTNTTSYIKKTLAFDDSFKIEFDFWMDQTTNLVPSTTTIILFNMADRYTCEMVLKPESAKLRIRAYDGLGGNTLFEGSGSLQPNKLNHVIFNVKKQVGDSEGAVAFELNDKLVSSDIFDNTNTATPTEFRIGAQGSIASTAMQLEVGNVLINNKDIIDYSDRFTGSFTAQSGETVTVVNGIIVTAV